MLGTRALGLGARKLMQGRGWRVRAAGIMTAVALLWTTAAGAQRMQRTPDIHYVPTPNDVVAAMLSIADVGPSDVVYDLGSGDGRIVIAAAKRGARGVGIELEPSLVAEANKNAKRAGVADRVSFIEGDIFQTDVSAATVVTLYLLSSINERLKP